MVSAMHTRFPSFVEVNDEGPVSVSIRPNDGACPMYLVDLRTEFVLGVGRAGCRWELGLTQDDLAFARSTWDAVVAGRVNEVFGPGRSRVRVQLPGGLEREARWAEFPAGCLPVPRWTRNRKRTIRYAAYRPETGGQSAI